MISIIINAFMVCLISLCKIWLCIALWL